MKKLLTFTLVVTLIMSVFTVGASAVDHYTPKTVTAIWDAESETVKLPEDCVIYLGDTITFPIADMVFFGNFEVDDDSGTVEENATVRANTMHIFKNGEIIGSFWGDSITFDDSYLTDPNTWFLGSASIGAGKYMITVIRCNDDAWRFYKASKEIFTFTVVDPKTVDEIVVPGSKPATSSEAPTESTEAPVESTEAPTESTDAPTESKPTTSKPAASEEPTDTEPAKSNPWLWIIIAAVAVVVIVVIIVVAKKKKK